MTTNYVTLNMLPVTSEIGTYTVRIIAQKYDEYLYNDEFIFTLIILPCYDYLDYVMMAIPSTSY